MNLSGFGNLKFVILYMTLSDRISAFSHLGSFLKQFLKAFKSSSDHLADDSGQQLKLLVIQTSLQNQWFRQEDILLAIQSIANQMDNIEAWLQGYSDAKGNLAPKNIGVIMAGNIPLAGFFDFFYVLMSGNKILVKLSAQDDLLLPFLAYYLVKLNPEFKEHIHFVQKLQNFDAVIASGSGNSSRYFEYYFGKVPHIIRKNRNSCAIFTGNETEEELKNLGKDIFSYFGAGCRNVSKLYVPDNYSFDEFFRAQEENYPVIHNNRYANNYEYNKAIFLVKTIPFLDNGFLMIREDSVLNAPRAVLHYDFYTDISNLNEEIERCKNEIQCVVGQSQLNTKLSTEVLPFGSTQNPNLKDYADHVDVWTFLNDLSSEC